MGISFLWDLEHSVDVEDELLGEAFPQVFDIGAYSVEYIRQRPEAGKFDIARAIKWASKAAAASAQHLGSLAGIPWEDDIDPA